MPSENSPLPIIAIGLIGALIAGLGLDSFNAIDLKDVTPANIGEVFLTLVFVALVIERSTEVYVNTSLEPVKQTHLDKVRAEAAKVRAARTALEAERKSQAPAESLLTVKEATLAGALQDLEKATVEAEPGLIRIQNKIARRAGLVAAALGVLIALVGVRALHPFLPSQVGFGGAFQEGLFEAVDVLVTGALLAGGADGLHKIVERFLKFAGKKDEPTG
jgi:hypothetical protein